MNRKFSLMALMFAAMAAEAADKGVYGDLSSRSLMRSRKQPVVKFKAQPEEREFVIKGHKIMARSKKDAIIRAKHKGYI